jgi:hypothetical protein
VKCNGKNAVDLKSVSVADGGEDVNIAVCFVMLFGLAERS